MASEAGLEQATGEFWDDRYGSSEQLFSGDPNVVLVAEVTGLQPGQALDVGCGEGGDARWLASQGWKVTAVDVSKVALERAAAASPGTDIAWTHADLTTATMPAGSFELVSVHYFPLLQQNDHSALRALLASVAPGGTLLFVGHDVTDMDPDHAGDFNPDDYYSPHEVAELLDDDWTVLVDEVRPRPEPSPGGHVNDTVLRAQRRL
jgi:SAM-dependent methyltransferase